MRVSRLVSLCLLVPVHLVTGLACLAGDSPPASPGLLPISVPGSRSAVVASEASPEPAHRGGGFAYDPTSQYDTKGVNGPRGFSAEAPHELIDPYTGNLVLSHVDFSLPGKGGLDLSIRRIYNSKVHRNYAALASGDANRIGMGMLFVPPSPVGLGWTLHMGRLVGAANGLSNEDLSFPRFYERPDGSSHPFFTGSFYEEDDVAYSVCFALATESCLLSKDYDVLYRLSSAGPWRVSTGDGLVITFGHQAQAVDPGVDQLFYHYATEIRDVHGDTIQIHYVDDPARPYMGHFIDFITDSLGRTIDFIYDDVEGDGVLQLASITAGGRTYRYEYSPVNPWSPYRAFLTAAVPPEGAPWRYEYAGLSNGECAANNKRWCELTRLTYPHGATLDYTYEHKVFFAGQNVMSARAVTRRVAGGVETVPGTWTYQYNRQAAYTGDDHTVIIRPDGSKEATTYFGVANAQYYAAGKAWAAGTLLKKQIRTANDEVVEQQNFVWQPSSPISGERWGDGWIGFDSAVYIPQLVSSTLRRGNLEWVTINLTFARGNLRPRCTTEGETNGPKRHTLSVWENWKRTIIGEHLFRFIHLEELTMVSATPFTQANCDPEQQSQLALTLDDELIQRQFDATTARLTRVESNGIVTDHQYNSDGSIDRQILYRGKNPDGSPTQGYCTSYRRYTWGIPDRIGHGATAPGCVPSEDLVTEHRTIDADGTVRDVTSSPSTQAAQTTAYEYDGLGRFSKITPPPASGEAAIRISHRMESGFDRVQRVEQGAYWLEKRFDGFGRVLTQETAAGVHVRTRYDALGRREFESQPSAAAVPADSLGGDLYSFDALGRITKITHPNGSALTYQFDPDLHQITAIDEMGNPTVYRYRAYGNPNETTLIRIRMPQEPDPAEDTYLYTVGGHLKQVNYAGKIRTIDYNLAKNVVHVSHPESGDTWFAYDAAGNLRCRARISGNGYCHAGNYEDPLAEVRYQIDGLARVVQVIYNPLYHPGGFTADVQHQYDPDSNNLRLMTDGTGTHEFFYTAANRLDRRVSTIAGKQYTTSYTYDERGNPKTLTYPSGRVVAYDWSAGNQLMRVSDATRTYASNFAYHPNGNPSAVTYGNGAVQSLSLDSRHRPKDLRVTHPTTGRIVDLSYDFQADSNLQKLTDLVTPGDTTSYEYADGRNRLTRANGAWGNLEYQYDAAGDRILEILDGQATSYQYDPGGKGQLQSLSGRVNVTALQYDWLGRITDRQVPGSADRFYKYDAEDRVVEVQRYNPADGSQPTVVSYRYDGNGMRLRATRSVCDDRITHYDGAGNRIAESTASGFFTRELIVGNGRTIAELDLRALTFSPSSLDFGALFVGESDTRGLTLANRSDTALTITRTLPEPFAFGASVSLPIVIPAGSQVQVPIVFSPAAAGTFDAALQQCEGDGAVLDVAIRGQAGTEATAALDITSHDFGEISVGSSRSFPLKITNNGTGPLRISGWKSTDPALSVSPAGPLVVQPGGQIGLTVTLDTSRLCSGAYTANLLLESNSIGIQSISISGTALGLSLSTSQTSAGMGFGPVADGQSSTRNLLISNQSAVDLTPSIKISGSPRFELAGPMAAVPAGQTVNVSIRYTGGRPLWSPFGDHATLSMTGSGCAAACGRQVHLTGNVPSETVALGCERVNQLSPAGTSLELLCSGSSGVELAARDAAGQWTSSGDLSGGDSNALLALMTTAPDGTDTVLWHMHRGHIQTHAKKLRQRPPGGAWSPVCSVSNAYYLASGALATAENGETWMAWEDYGPPPRTHLGAVFTSYGACLPGNASYILEAGSPSGLVAVPGGGFIVVGGRDGPWAATIHPTQGVNMETLGLSAIGSQGRVSLAVDPQQGWHLAWTGRNYADGTGVSRPHSVYRDAAGQWRAPKVLGALAQDPSSPTQAVDDLGAVFAAWTDTVCSDDQSPRLYYGVLRHPSHQWTVTEVSTPGFTNFTSATLAHQDGQVYAAWSADRKGARGGTTVLYQSAEIGNQPVNTTSAVAFLPLLLGALLGCGLWRVKRRSWALARMRVFVVAGLVATAGEAGAEVVPRISYYHEDATGNLVAKTDPQGNVIWRASVRPFGQGTATPGQDPLQFLESPLESDIGGGGLYHLGARYMDPETGRFLTPDPLSVIQVSLSEPQRFNRYAYGLNNPYRFVDPAGDDPVPTFKELFPKLDPAEFPIANALLESARESGVQLNFSDEGNNLGHFSERDNTITINTKNAGTLQDIKDLHQDAVVTLFHELVHLARTKAVVKGYDQIRDGALREKAFHDFVGKGDASVEYLMEEDRDAQTTGIFIYLRLKGQSVKLAEKQAAGDGKNWFNLTEEKNRDHYEEDFGD